MQHERNETKLQYHRRRISELKKIRQPWEETWAGVSDFIEPNKLRLVEGAEQPKSRKKIIDTAGTMALRILASGMHSGITSPARPWFRLITSDAELTEYEPVKHYLAKTGEKLRTIFQSSNIYTSFHSGYSDLGQFGQSCALLVEDQKSIVSMTQLLHGQFWLARDRMGRATTLYRTFSWSTQRIVERFGIDKVSDAVKTNYEQGVYDQRHVIFHAVEPRLDRDSKKDDKTNMPFLSNYWEENAMADQLLEESGFSDNPIIAPPWELSGGDDYSNSPGQIALPDVKMLQQEQKRKLEAIDKMVRPPMTGPTSLMGNKKSLLPGSITYSDDPTGKGFRPAMDVDFRLGDLINDIQETRGRINSAFYADLFLMISNMEGIQPRNQFEIAERKEEKLLALGPVLENIFTSQLKPTIERTYMIARARGVLPEIPEELKGQEMKIEYTSMLAQAQRAVATGGLERVWAFAGNLAAMKPDVLDKVDADQSIDLYSNMLGVDPSMVVADDKVKKVREARAEQEAQAQRVEQATTVAPAIKTGAESAKVLSEIDDNPGAADLLSRIGLN